MNIERHRRRHQGGNVHAGGHAPADVGGRHRHRRQRQRHPPRRAHAPIGIQRRVRPMRHRQRHQRQQLLEADPGVQSRRTGPDRSPGTMRHRAAGPAARAQCPACNSVRRAAARSAPARSAARRRWPGAAWPRASRPVSAVAPSARHGRRAPNAARPAATRPTPAGPAPGARCAPGRSCRRTARCAWSSQPIACGQKVGIQPRLGRAGLGRPVVAPGHQRRHRHQDAFGAPARSAARSACRGRRPG